MQKFTTVTGFLIAIIGALIYYSKSKYCPEGLTHFLKVVPRWVGLLPLVATAIIYYLQWGWAVGLLLWLTAVPLAYCSVVFLSRIRPSFTLFFIFLLTVLLSIDLLN